MRRLIGATPGREFSDRDLPFEIIDALSIDRERKRRVECTVNFRPLEETRWILLKIVGAKRETRKSPQQLLSPPEASIRRLGGRTRVSIETCRLFTWRISAAAPRRPMVRP